MALFAAYSQRGEESFLRFLWALKRVFWRQILIPWRCLSHQWVCSEVKQLKAAVLSPRKIWKIWGEHFTLTNDKFWVARWNRNYKIEIYQHCTNMQRPKNNIQREREEWERKKPCMCMWAWVSCNAWHMQTHHQFNQENKPASKPVSKQATKITNHAT